MAKAKVSQTELTQAKDQQLDERDLKLTMDQYRQLEQIYYAIGELSEMISPPHSTGGGLQCLMIVNSSLGTVIDNLQAQAQGGAQ